MRIIMSGPDRHIPVRTPEDITVMEKELNGLHDGEIIGIDFKRNVRSADYTTWCESGGTEMILKVLVTSMREKPVVELCFRDVIEWKIGNLEFFWIAASFGNFVTFTGEMSADLDFLRGLPNPMYVAAGEMYWRILEKPGLHLNRGGLETGKWDFVPEMPLCLPTKAEKYEEIIRRFADRISDGNLVFTITKMSDHGTEEEKKLLQSEENYRFTTETLPSFLDEKGIPPVDDQGRRWIDNDGFRWYELADRAMLTEVLFMSHHGGGMVAIADEGGFACLFEVIENGGDNLVIYAREPLTRDELNGFYEKYKMQFYSGRSIWEELS